MPSSPVSDRRASTVAEDAGQARTDGGGARDAAQARARGRARADGGPLQARARRPRQLPQALGARGRAPASRRPATRCCATGSRRSTASSAALRMEPDGPRRPGPARGARADGGRPRPPGRRADRRASASPSTPSATRRSGCARPTEVPDRTVVEVRALGLRARRPGPAPAAGGRRARGRSAERLMAGRASATTTRSLGVPRGRERGGHPRAPTASSRASTTPTSTRSRAPRTASRRSPRPTRSCATPRSASATTASARTGRPAQDVSGAPGGASVAARRRRGFEGFGDGRVRRRARRVRRGRLQRLLRGPVRRRRARRPRRPRRRLRRLLDARRRPGGRARADARGGRARRQAARSRSATAATTRSTSRPACATASASGSPARAARHGGGPPGDLFLRVRLRPHPRFRVEGRDLYVDLPVAPWEAALGATVEVPTLDGTRAREGAAGLVERAAAAPARQGLPGPRGGHGDLYAVVKIDGPQEARPTRSASCSSSSPRCRSSTRAKGR